MSYKPNNVVSGLISEKDLCRIREAVCVQVEKVYDSCKEKDCIEDAEVIFRNPEKVQMLIDRAINVKCNRAEVLDVFADVEPVPFRRGFFTVDVKYFIKVKLDFFVPYCNGSVKVVSVPGLVVFDKKIILFGSEGNVKIFKSHYVKHGIDTPVRSTLQQDNLPTSKIEVAEPICLNAQIEEVLDEHFICCGIDQVPRNVMETLEDEEEDYDETAFSETTDESRHHHNKCRKVVVVSIGLFSIVKLVRFVQLLVPAFDFCVPNKKCIASTDENPCEIFDTIEFPVDEFFPPQKFDFPGAVEEERALIEEGLED